MAMEWMPQNVLNNESQYDKNELDNVREVENGMKTGDENDSICEECLKTGMK